MTANTVIIITIFITIGIIGIALLIANILNVIIDNVRAKFRIAIRNINENLQKL